MRELFHPRERYYEHFAARMRGSRTGTVNIKECPVCGHVDLVFFRPGPVNDYLVHRMSSDDTCERCAEIARRHPELLAWIMGVVSMVLRDTRPPEEPQR